MTLYQPRLTPLTISSTNSPVRSLAFQSTPAHQLYSNKTRKILTGAASLASLNALSLYDLTVESDILPSFRYDGNEDEMITGNGGNAENVKEPLSECLASVNVLGEVNQIKFVSEDIAAVATSQGRKKNGEIVDGQVALFSIKTTSAIPELNCVHKWESDSNPLALAVQSIGAVTFASGTDAGNLTFYDPSSQQIIRSIDHANTSAITSLAYAGAHTLYGTSLNGSLFLWDVRDPTLTKPSQSIRRTKNTIGLLSLSAHPSRFDTVICGDEKGIVTTFDVRRGTEGELMSLQVGNSAVWGVALLPFDPAASVVVTEDGVLSLIDFNVNKREPALVSYDNKDGSGIEVRSLYVGSGGMNCLDIDRSSHTIVAGNDAQNLVHFQYLLS